MINLQCVYNRGFTLIETIIYVALFGILMVGVIASIQPIFAGVERMSEKVMIENEITLVSRTIVSLIPQASSVTVDTGTPNKITIFVPVGPGLTYVFWAEDGAIASTVNGTPYSLTASRVNFTDMQITKIPIQNGVPAYIEITYIVDVGDDNIVYGPIRSYLNF